MALRDMLFGKPDNSTSFSPLTQAHKDRQALFAQFWRYYRGHHRKPLKVRPNTLDDNVVLNYSKRNVNKSVQFLFGKPVTFEIDSQSEGRTPQELYLDSVWGEAEKKAMFLQKLALNGGVTGTAVLRLYEPEPNTLDSLPRIVNIDPSIVDVVTHADDIEEVLSYRLIWLSGKIWKRHRIDLQENDTWFVTVEIAKSNSPDWQEVANESAPWPYTFPPIILGQNLPIPNETWGMGDLEEADINDAINFTASNVSRILKFHAHPKTIGTGFSAAALQNTAIDDFWAINDPLARVANLEMQSDLASAFNFLAALRTAYSKVSNVPDLDPAVVNVGALSGFALRILYGDLTELTAVKQNTYGALLKEANKSILALGKQGEYGSVEVNNVWLDPLPSSGLEEAQTLEIDKRNGLSTETYLTKRGYDPEQEAEKRKADQEEREAQMGTALTNAMRGFDRGTDEDA